MTQCWFGRYSNQWTPATSTDSRPVELPAAPRVTKGFAIMQCVHQSKVCSWNGQRELYMSSLHLGLQDMIGYVIVHLFKAEESIHMFVSFILPVTCSLSLVIICADCCQVLDIGPIWMMKHDETIQPPPENHDHLPSSPPPKLSQKPVAAVQLVDLHAMKKAGERWTGEGMSLIIHSVNIILIISSVIIHSIQL